MAETPSARRRKGRNDFEPGVDPVLRCQLNPYLPASNWMQQMKADDWLDGWKEAEAKWEEEQEEQEVPDLIRERCPHCGQEM